MYLVMKLVHVVAVIMFLGNITTGLFWKAHADRSRDPRVIAHTLHGIIRSDMWFTNPGAILIVITGFGAAGIGGYPILRTEWILWSLILFTISGLAFGFQVAPLQRRMWNLVRAATDPESLDWDLYHRLSRRWEIWGAVALIAPFAVLLLMVFKPAG
jgi:uncharacterized membrane protein